MSMIIRHIIFFLNPVPHVKQMKFIITRKIDKLEDIIQNMVKQITSQLYNAFVQPDSITENFNLV